VCFVLAGLLIARLTTLGDARSTAMFGVSLVAFVVICEHLLPVLITRRDPEQALDILLTAFHPLARLIQPLTAVLVGMIDGRRERESANGAGSTVTTAEASTAAPEGAEENAITEEEGRVLLQSVVDFTETLVREVMTPRPDIVAVAADAS